MYVYRRDSNAPESEVSTEFKYWRKNNALHHWMYQLWCKKQGGDMDLDEFNCKAMELTIDDIIQLMSDIKKNKLVPTAGFFWGELEYPDWRKEEDWNFCFNALDELRSGARLIYCADW